MNSIVDDLQLALAGANRMTWFRSQMPIIRSLSEKYEKEQTFKGKTIAICMHVEPKTAYWIEGLLAGGADHIYLVGCLGTTKADTAAYLASLDRVTVFAKTQDTMEDHQVYLEKALGEKPHLLLDNGASLTLAYHSKDRDWVPEGCNEETRSGKLLIEDAKIAPAFPIIVIDDSPLKQLLENAIGVGQSVVDGFMRNTSLLVGGKHILVIGYGWCGSGIAKKFQGLGASTMVYDIDPVFQLKAKAEGHQVGVLEDLLPRADVVITVTGRFDVINASHISFFKEGVILANSGHYGLEINTQDLKDQAQSVETVKAGVDMLTYGDKSIFLLQDASPLNLSAGDGNPIEIMDLGLGLQSASAERLLVDPDSLKRGLQAVPEDINRSISLLSLEAMA